MEEWRQVKGYGGLYEVSSEGRIKTARREGSQGGVLVPHCHRKSRYPMINLCRDGKTRMEYIHRLVAEAFLGPCPPGYEVDHINRARTDNHVGNLRYVPKELNKRLAGHAAIGYKDGVPVSRVENATTISLITGIAYHTVRRRLKGKGLIINGLLWKYC